MLVFAARRSGLLGNHSHHSSVGYRFCTRVTTVRAPGRSLRFQPAALLNDSSASPARRFTHHAFTLRAESRTLNPKSGDLRPQLGDAELEAGAEVGSKVLKNAIESAKVKDPSEVSQAPDVVEPPPESSESPPRSNEPDPNGIYIGNLDFQTTEDQLRNLFGPYGQIRDITIVTDYKGDSRGYAFLNFSDQLSAKKAIETLHQTDFNGRRLLVQPNKSFPRPGLRRYRQVPATRCLYVGNLPFEMSDKDLNDLFRQARNVVQIRVAIDKATGQPRGFAHADFVDLKSAAEAKEWLSEQVILGRKLKVDYARQNRAKRDSQQTSGQTTDSSAGGSNDAASKAEILETPNP